MEADIFTGTFPHTNGMVTNGVPLGANVKTIGQRLTDNGIKCGYIGNVPVKIALRAGPQTG